MAKVTTHKQFTLDMRDLDFSTFFYGIDYAGSSSVYRIFYSNVAIDEFRGKGFRYDSGGEPVAGTVSSYAVFVSGVRTVAVDGVSIAATAIVDAARTYSTKDDSKVIQKALAGNDAIKGGNGNDIMYGYGGNDSLVGNLGNDRLSGGAGNDKITGGMGADRLYGGSGADRFIFKSVEESTVGNAGRDKIYDFSRSQRDKIDLSAADANLNKSGNQDFRFIGTAEFHKRAGEVRYEKKSGDTFIFADANGDGTADFSIALEQYVNLKASDFIL